MHEPTVVREMTEAVLRKQLRVHVAERSLYPECVWNLLPLNEAIVLCACGQSLAEVIVRGRRTQADIVVLAFHLESFVHARMVAYCN